MLLDPVTFLLHDPAIANNFINRVPTTSMELLISYFVSKELYIAHTLARHFSWSHNVLFHEELAGVQGLRHHFGPFPTNSSAAYHPSRGVWRALLGGHAYGVLIGACNPMLWPIHVFRWTPPSS